MAPGPGARLGAPARWTVQVRLPVSPPAGTRPSPPAPGCLRRPCSSGLRAAGRLPGRLQVPGLAAPPHGPGAGTPNSLLSSLPRPGARRAAWLQAPRPAGNNGRGEKRCLAAASGKPLRSAERTTCAPPGRASCGRTDCSSAPPPGFYGQTRASLPRLLWWSPAGPSQGSRRNPAEPGCPPGLHQRPPPPERPPATPCSRAPEYS